MLPQSETNLVYRVLDANLNRAVEGLRAAEEFFRFVSENKYVTGQLKNFRHEVDEICRNWIDIWSGQRDSQADVGATLKTKDEYQRSSLTDLVGANLARVNQALRALEEYSKAVCPELPAQLESARYRFYELEKVVKRSLFVDRNLSDRSIYVLTSGCKTHFEFESRIRDLCDSGADLIQLRDKDLHDGELLERAKSAVKICSDFSTLFIVNDRPDIALLSEADGVHVGQEELSVREIRKIFPHRMLIGLSTHSLEQARQAEKDGADYIGVGPTFKSHTKCFSEFTGPELLREVSENISTPAFAIGGISLENIDQVAAAGFKRVAVSGAVHQSGAVSKTIEQLRSSLQMAAAKK